jgi:predicted nucleic acid-binding protein
MPGYVLDTSALVALLTDEEGADEVEQILRRGERSASGERGAELYLPFMTLMELEYVLLQRWGALRAEMSLRVIGVWPVRRVESHFEWGRAAARVKAATALSLGDAWNAALTLMLDADLVHKDPEFDRVEGLRHFRLPYKQKKPR